MVGTQLEQLQPRPLNHTDSTLSIPTSKIPNQQKKNFDYLDLGLLILLPHLFLFKALYIVNSSLFKYFRATFSHVFLGLLLPSSLKLGVFS